MKALPTSWVEVTLGDVARWGSGGTPTSSSPDYYGGDIPWAVIGDLTDGWVEATAKSITARGLNESSAKLVEPGTLLIAMYGSIGRLGIARTRMATNQAIATAAPDTGVVDPAYLFWYLRSQRAKLTAAGKGATQDNIGQAVLKAWPIPLAPLAEQRRIVEAIDEQLSRLSAAGDSLRVARSRLTTLRNVVLKLLQPIGVPRARLGDVADIRLGRQRSPKNHAGPHMRPYLRAANVTWHGLDLSDVKQMNFAPSEVSVFQLAAGDVLVAEASGSASEVGKPAVWRQELDGCCFQNTLLRVRSDRYLPEYLCLLLFAAARSGQFATIARGVGIHHLGKRGLEDFVLAVPSLAEQRDLVTHADQQVSILETLERNLGVAARRAQALRDSVLREAFAGRLVTRQIVDLFDSEEGTR